MTLSVYVKTSVGTADEDDFESVIKQAIEFKSNELTKTLQLIRKRMGFLMMENILLELYKTSDLEDGNYTDYGKAFIANNANAATAVSNYTYVITGSNDTQAKTISEGSDLVLQ